MVKRRRLADLYERGKEITFDDGAGEPITVFVRKLTPIEHEKAMRAANANRTRVLLARRHPDSDEYAEMWGEVEGYGRDDLTTYLVLQERQSREAPVEAELAAEEEWSKDNYLQGLRDDWNEELSDRYAQDPEDPEALRCFDEMSRFAAELETALEGVLEATRRDLESKTDDELRTAVFDAVVNVHASMAWITEYRRQEVYLGTREADHKSRYFVDRNELDETPVEVIADLQRVYREISVDPTEGKGLAEIPPSSPSSEPVVEGATEDSSGPKEVAA